MVTFTTFIRIPVSTALGAASMTGAIASGIISVSLYIYHFSTVIDFSPEKYHGSTGHTGIPGTSRGIYSEDDDGETRTRNPWITNPVL